MVEYSSCFIIDMIFALMYEHLFYPIQELNSRKLTTFIDTLNGKDQTR